jgi:signal recognition particle subunit SRP54
MFNSLSDKILNVLGTFKKKSVITEKDLKNTLRDLRIALLEADVSIKVVMSFIKNVEEKAIGSNIYNTITPYQMIVKILHQEIINTLSDGSELLIQKNHTVYMLVGLQGSGKTTSAAKLAYFLKNKHKKRILLASVDTFRMAAYEQLKVLASQISVDFFTHDVKQTPLQIAKDAYKFSQEKGYDALILDTAGRISTDKELMDEISNIKNNINPQEILFVADSMIGQSSSTVAQEFHSKVNLTGIILSKVDGDSRGGSALSMKLATNVPIKFSGIGEKVDKLEIFNPIQIADRILGKGDIISLVDKVAELSQEEDDEEMMKNITKGTFTLVDYKKQLQTMGKMGGISSIFSMIPGLSSLKDKIDTNKMDNNILKKQTALIDSMTKQERLNPKIIQASRKIRIANGSGLKVQDINILLKQHEKSSEMMKKFKNLGLKGITNMFKSLKG